MKYRLGLDMGTDSIGWAVIELSNDKKPSGIVDMGVVFLTAEEIQRHMNHLLSKEELPVA